MSMVKLMDDKHDAPEPKILSETAKRALEEAEDRRTKLAGDQKSKEVGGRGGLDPARYGDWEVKGIVSDF